MMIGSKKKLERCANCGHTPLRDETVTDRFEYRVDDNEVITVEAQDVPVEACPQCGEQFFGPAAVRAQHAAVCQALGLLSPQEIQAIRERFGPTQTEFGRLTGIGEATISRWERGRLLPSRALDRYLRLLSGNPANVVSLKGMANGIRCNPPTRVAPAQAELQLPRNDSINWILCVDWGKELRKRRAWVADVANRMVRKLEGERWTLANVLAAARRFEGHVVVSIDAALGIPMGYLEHLRASAPAWRDADGFLSWLRRAAETPGFFTESHDATHWQYDRPFIAVPGGKGSLDAFWARASGPLLRGVERATGAKSAFIVSGIPGTVGSGTRALWKELAPLFRPMRDFGVWPFEGSLATLFERHRIVLGEIYPCVCYALALDDKLPAPLHIIAKTKAGPRAHATRCLLRLRG